MKLGKSETNLFGYTILIGFVLLIVGWFMKLKELEGLGLGIILCFSFFLGLGLAFEKEKQPLNGEKLKVRIWHYPNTNRIIWENEKGEIRDIIINEAEATALLEFFIFFFNNALAKTGHKIKFKYKKDVLLYDKTKKQLNAYDFLVVEDEKNSD